MLSNHNDSTTIRQYLLGQLGDAGRDQFEERLFTDEELLDELLLTEDDLIEASISGELGPDEESFNRNFLITPERQQKLLFRKSLRRVAKSLSIPAQPPPSPLPWFRQNWVRWAAQSVAVVVILSASLSVLRLYQTLSVELALNNGSSDRAAGQLAQRIKLPHRFSSLKLHLNLPPPPIPARDYRVEMLTADDTVSLTPVSHHEQVVDLKISAADLPPGQYAFHVYAVKPDGTEQRIAGSYLLTVD